MLAIRIVEPNKTVMKKILNIAKQKFAFALIGCSILIGFSSAMAQSTIFNGDEVIAHGYGSAWTLRGAKLEAYDQLMEDRARIEASIPAHLRIEWGQIRGTEMSYWSSYGWHLTQVGTVYDPNGAVCYSEFMQLMDILEAAEQQIIDDLDARGWIGNMTEGSKCDEVHDYIQNAIRRIVNNLNAAFTCYDVVSLCDYGWLPNEYAAHIYLGVIDKNTGEVMYVLDPWRYAGSCHLIPFEQDPNGGNPDEVIPWELDGTTNQLYDYMFDE